MPNKEDINTGLNCPKCGSDYLPMERSSIYGYVHFICEDCGFEFICSEEEAQ